MTVLRNTCFNIFNPMKHKKFYIGIFIYFLLALDEKYVCSTFINSSMFSKSLLMKIIFSSLGLIGYISVVILGLLTMAYETRSHQSIKSILHRKIYWLWVMIGIFAMLVLPNIVDSTNNSPNQKWIYKLIKSDPITTCVFVTVGVLIAPAIEEIVDRGIFFNLFDIDHLNLLSKTILICIDSVLFASGHMTSNLPEFLSYAVAGAILGACYLHTKSIPCTYAIHAFTNGLGFLSMFLALK